MKTKTKNWTDDLKAGDKVITVWGRNIEVHEVTRTTLSNVYCELDQLKGGVVFGKDTFLCREGSGMRITPLTPEGLLKAEIFKNCRLLNQWLKTNWEEDEFKKTTPEIQSQMREALDFVLKHTLEDKC